MTTFIVLAALALVAGVAAVTLPLLWPRPGGPPPAPWAALAAAVLLVAGSAFTYAKLSNWTWKPAAADSPETMVAHLARKLERNPDNKEGWLLLGRSYSQLKLWPLSARAYERANRLYAGRNFDALMGEALALIQDDDSQLGGRAGALLEQAIALQPDSGDAVLYGAFAAAQRGDYALAKARFQKILALNPPERVRTVLLEQIAALDQRMAGGGAAPAAAADGPAVRVTVQLSPKVAKPDAASTLYVLVRDPARPGMPLAAKRLESRFPQTVVLTPQDAMAGQPFAAGQKVQVVARISRSGNPLAASGDPFGEVAYRVGKDGLVNITINQVTP